MMGTTTTMAAAPLISSGEYKRSFRHQAPEQDRLTKRRKLLASEEEVVMMDVDDNETTRQWMEVRAERVTCRQANALTAGHLLLQPLPKLHPGLGSPLSGFRAQAVPLAHVGSHCPGMFPSTWQEVTTLDSHRLNWLAIWYNESFGIVERDCIAVRRVKFLQWCSSNRRC